MANKWFEKIESREQAINATKEASTLFFCIAGLQALLSFLVGMAILWDAAFLAIGAFFLRQFKSRTAAILLLLLTGGEACVTFLNKFGGEKIGGGGSNIFLAAICVAGAIRAVDATFKFHGKFAVRPSVEPTQAGIEPK